MKVQGIECPYCKDQIWSRHTHDFRTCKCGKVFVDGGRDYLRVGGMDADVVLAQIRVIDIDTGENKKNGKTNQDT